MLRLVTLGRLELQRDGAPPELVPVQPKRLALLAYLSFEAERDFCRRDPLLALLWPERSQAAARHALRHALYHLRNILGEGVLLSRGTEELRLARPMWHDALAFEHAWAANLPGDALALYRGDFLAGVFVDGASSEWDEWVSRTRARLRGRAAAAAWTAAEQAIRAGDITRGLDAARRAQELDPDDEIGIQRLMRWLEQFGRRPAALQLFGEHARRMRGEYRADPSPDTAALAEAIRTSTDPPVPRSATTGPQTEPRVDRPFRRTLSPCPWRWQTAARRRVPRSRRPCGRRIRGRRVPGRAFDTESPR